MGNTKLWFTPHGSVRNVAIDLGARLQERPGPRLLYRQAVQESVGGASAVTLFGGRSRFSIRHVWQRDGGSGDTLRRNLVALTSHLQRGGTCMLAEDVDYAFAAFFTTPPPADTQIFSVEGNVFEQLAPSVDIDGREAWVQSDHDNYIVEPKLVSAHVSGSGLVTLSTAIRSDLSHTRWVCLREYGSWPALRMPIEFRETGDFVSHEHESRYILDLPLEEDPLGMDLLAANSTGVTGTTDWPGIVIDPWDSVGPLSGPTRGWW